MQLQEVTLPHSHSPLEPHAVVYTDAAFVFKRERGVFLSLALIKLGSGEKYLYYRLGGDKTDNNEIESYTVSKVQEFLDSKDFRDYQIYTDSTYAVGDHRSQFVHHVPRELNEANMYIHTISEYFRNKYLHSSRIDYIKSETFKQIN